jgi:hypothetical protein
VVLKHSYMDRERANEEANETHLATTLAHIRLAIPFACMCAEYGHQARVTSSAVWRNVLHIDDEKQQSGLTRLDLRGRAARIESNIAHCGSCDKGSEDGWEATASTWLIMTATRSFMTSHNRFIAPDESAPFNLSVMW